MKSLKFALLGSALIIASPAFAQAMKKPCPPVSASAAKTEGSGATVTASAAKPEGSGTTVTASAAKPEGSGATVTASAAKPEGNGAVVTASANADCK